MLNHAAKNLESILLPEFAPFPKWGDPAWQALPQETRESLIRDAQALQGAEWPVLPAVLYMDFVRNGNRIRYSEGKN